MQPLNKAYFSNKLHPLEGVEGLLLLLCMTLIIVSPVINFQMLFPGPDLFEQLRLMIAGDIKMLIFDFFSLLMIVFSIVSGILLWNRKRIGVLFAKIFLILSIISNSIGILILLMNRIIAFELVRIIGSGICIPVIWIIYLFTSVRVKNTYFKSS